MLENNGTKERIGDSIVFVGITPKVSSCLSIKSIPWCATERSCRVAKLSSLERPAMTRPRSSRARLLNIHNVIKTFVGELIHVTECRSTGLRTDTKRTSPRKSSFQLTEFFQDELLGNFISFSCSLYLLVGIRHEAMRRTGIYF